MSGCLWPARRPRAGHACSHATLSRRLYMRAGVTTDMTSNLPCFEPNQRTWRTHLHTQLLRLLVHCERPSRNIPDHSSATFVHHLELTAAVQVLAQGVTGYKALEVRPLADALPACAVVCALSHASLYFVQLSCAECPLPLVVPAGALRVKPSSCRKPSVSARVFHTPSTRTQIRSSVSYHTICA